MNGKITDIETMGLVDGPNMRLVLFLAGCKLRCLYCHNPETWSPDGTREISPEEVLKMYNKYKNYYGDKGGVTFSGGEPLLQSEFVLETIKLLNENGIHTAIDTAGVGEKNYDEILKLVDLVILDVKAVDSDEYKFITGREITDFNNFIQKCVNLNKKLWLRQVIVPNINDDKDHVLKLKEFAKSIPNVEKIELLPYHSMGKEKYKKLGISYRLETTIDMDKDRCNELQKLLEEKA